MLSRAVHEPSRPQRRPLPRPRSHRPPQRKRPMTAKSCTRGSKCPILDLPNEILIMILEDLDGLQSLASIVETCRRFHELFNENIPRLIEVNFARTCARVRYHNVGRVFRELCFAIRRDFLPRDCVKKAFAKSWPIFEKRQLAELLLPLARHLAWSYCIDEREDDAIELLTNVWHRQQPFCQSEDSSISKERPPSYIIVGSLLQDLVDEPEKGLIVLEVERLQASRGELRAYLVRVNQTRVTLTTKMGLDTIPVFFPPRLPFSPT